MGWKDPYSSEANTARQKSYATALGEAEIFTPQLIINGRRSVLGSDETKVRDAILDARSNTEAVKIDIKAEAGELSVEVRNTDPSLTEMSKFGRSISTR